MCSLYERFRKNASLIGSCFVGGVATAFAGQSVSRAHCRAKRRGAGGEILLEKDKLVVF